MAFGGRVMFVTIAAGYCPRDNVNKLRPAAHYLKCQNSSALGRYAVSICKHLPTWLRYYDPLKRNYLSINKL